MEPADEDDIKFRNESSFETSKADGFADDNSTGTLFEYGSLLALKNILSDFAGISGLKCNTEKTALMQIGRVGPVPDEIADLGFLITDKIHILGMDIDANISELDSNFAKTVVSLKKCGLLETLQSVPSRSNKCYKEPAFFSDTVPWLLPYAESGKN